MTPLGWVRHYLLAILYRGLEVAGWMDESKGLGGQVAGYNFWREPIWLREIANLLRDWMVLMPLFLAVLFLWERCGAGWRQTVCGACGGWRWNADGACAGCGVHAGMSDASMKRRGWLTPMGSTLLRAGAWSGWAGASAHWLMEFLDFDALLRQRVFLKVGEMLGGEVMYVGVMVVGPNGPFVGDGFVAKVLNAGYRWGPELVMLAVAAVIAVVGARVLVRRGVVRYRGMTVCGGCGYGLVGVPGARCPECGDKRSGGLAEEGRVEQK
jgi:hypothetical protein